MGKSIMINETAVNDCEMATRRKVFVEVTLRVDEEGKIRPLTIKWEDGHIYEVDRLKRICRAASTRAGGCGIRYTVDICGKETYLFDEDGRWFVEAKI